MISEKMKDLIRSHVVHLVDTGSTFSLSWASDIYRRLEDNEGVGAVDFYKEMRKCHSVYRTHGGSYARVCVPFVQVGCPVCGEFTSLRLKDVLEGYFTITCANHWCAVPLLYDNGVVTVSLE